MIELMLFTVGGGPPLCPSRLSDVVVPFDAALHAAAPGRARARSPGKAFRTALRKGVERAIESSSPTTAS